jgi:hypothetical protein
MDQVNRSVVCPRGSWTAKGLRASRPTLLAAQRLARVLLGGALAALAACGSPEESDEYGAQSFATTNLEGAMQFTGRNRLDVRVGEVKKTKSGYFTIDGPQVRAEMKNRSDGNSAHLRFRYRGPSRGSKRLASGELRRQFGLKLRAKDSCNVLYAMWQFYPREQIVLSMKRNRGKSTSKQCGAQGYTSLATARASALQSARNTATAHRLTAVIVKEGKTTYADVYADSKRVIHKQATGAFGVFLAQVEGPAGFRSDNASLIFKFKAAERQLASPTRPDNRASANALARLRRWPYKHGPEGSRGYGSLYVATGDINADGHSDVIVGAPAGEKWGVSIFDGRTDALIARLSPFGSRYAGGVAVAAGDCDGDGHDDVLCATATAGTRNVLYDGATRRVLRRGLLPFGSRYRGGLSVAIGDLDGDGLGEIVMGQAPGAAGGVTVYRGSGGVLGRGLSPFGNRAGQGGVVVATGDLDRDGKHELIVGSGVGVNSSLTIYRYINHFSVYRRGLSPFGRSRCGLSVAAGDVDGDGRDDVLVGSACGGRVMGYSFANRTTSVLPRHWYPFGRDRLVGTRVAVAVGSRPLVFAPVSP